MEWDLRSTSCFSLLCWSSKAHAGHGSGGVGVGTRVGRLNGTYLPPPVSACCADPAGLMLDTEWWDRGGDQGGPVEWDLRSASCFSLLCWSSKAHAGHGVVG